MKKFKSGYAQSVCTMSKFVKDLSSINIPVLFCLFSRNLRASAHKGQVTVSTPYIDAFGAGTVVTLSKALYEGV